MQFELFALVDTDANNSNPGEDTVGGSAARQS